MRQLIFSAFLAGIFVFCLKPAWANGNPNGVSALPLAAAKPTAVKPKSVHLMTVWVTSGSIKSNVERLAHQFGWNQVIWQSPDDYDWVGNTKITAPDFPDVLMQLLDGYPLQAIFYEGNHILVVVPRNPT